MAALVVVIFIVIVVVRVLPVTCHVAVRPMQLISYIAPAAPATRRPATGSEPFLRPEIGFTPKWFRTKLGIDFGERWHTDPAYRRESVVAMRGELRRRFPGTSIGGIDRPDAPFDLLTGVHDACTIAGIYGLSILYAADRWPTCEGPFLSDEHTDALAPPDLGASPFFQQLMGQVDWIAEHEGRVEGFINWQGVLNNAHRLRGTALFYDLIDHPGRALHLFQCVCTTMIDAAQRLHARQRATGVAVEFFTVSNCLVNMVSPEQYARLLLPFDRRLALGRPFRTRAARSCTRPWTWPRSHWTRSAKISSGSPAITPLVTS